MLSKKCQIKDIVQNVPPLCNMQSKIVQNAIYWLCNMLSQVPSKKLLIILHNFFQDLKKNNNIRGEKTINKITH